MKPDTRTLGIDRAEIRVASDDRGTYIEGYAAVFDSESEDLGGFTEIIKPGAFTDALAGCDVRFVVNHDPNLILGRSTAGTLTLTQDARGLKYRVYPPKSFISEHYVESARCGNISGNSFRFYVPEDRSGESWESASGRTVRTITRFAKLDDVCLATYPAYPGTNGLAVSARSLEALEAHRRTRPRRDTWEHTAYARLRMAETDR